MDKTEFSQIMEFLSGSRPDQRTAISEATLKVYWLCLQDLPFDVAKAAVLQRLATNKWFPTIAELRDLAFRATDATDFPTAADAWAETSRAIQDVGCYGDPSQPYGTWWTGWSHPLIERVVNAMGWQSLCASTNEMADRAHFLRFYETMAERWKTDNQQLPEVKQLRERLRAQSLATRTSTPVALPEAREATHQVATGLATLATRLTVVKPAIETDGEREARLARKRAEALAYLSRKATIQHVPIPPGEETA